MDDVALGVLEQLNAGEAEILTFYYGESVSAESAEALAGRESRIGELTELIREDKEKVSYRLMTEDEETDVEVPAGFDSGKYHLTGNVTGEPPFKGRLMHPGWQATKCEVPKWSGSDKAANVVAPAEVELG